MRASKDFRQTMRDEIRKSYLHRKTEGCVCALCGSQDSPLALHLLEKSIKENEPLPNGFLPMAVSMGYVKGAFPVCDKCAPECKSCQLPIYTPNVHAYRKTVQAKLGVGYCSEHIQWKYVLKIFIKKLF